MTDDGLLNSRSMSDTKVSTNAKDSSAEKETTFERGKHLRLDRREAKRRNYEETRRAREKGRRRSESRSDTESCRKASKIAKFSLPEAKTKPSSCLNLDEIFQTREHFQNPVPSPTDDESSSALSLMSTSAATRLSRVERRSKKKRMGIESRKSLVIREEQRTTPSRPQSIASPPLTVPMTSSTTGFQFLTDMTACLSSDSAFFSSSSTQKSSTSSIVSSVHSVSVAPETPSTPSSSSSSSLHSLESPNPPPPAAPVSSVLLTVPSPSPSNVGSLKPFLLRSTVSRHSSRDDELRNNSRMTQIAWSSVLCDTRCGLVDDVTMNFKTMTIDRKCLRDKALTAAKKKFNSSPAKGIEHLIQSGLLHPSAASVAEFLFNEEGLKKSSIGDFLGERKDFNIEVLKAFVKLHNFKNLTLVQALRQFLWSFRLPGESQKIDRIMENFSDKFSSDNPEEYSGADTCFMLSFALVMLNTSLHNSNVRDKLNPERFETMVRVICQDQKVTSDQLMALYKSIKKDPLRFPEESGPDDFIGTFFNPTKEGWLYKKSKKYNQWKKRWFVLSNGCLYYFTYKTDQQPRAIVPLENLFAQKSNDKKKDHCLEIISTSNNSNNNNNINNNINNNSTSTGIIKSCKTQVFGKVVEGTRTSFKLAAFSLKDNQEWIDSINKNTTNNPLQKLMVERRSKTLLSLRSRKKVTSVVASPLLEEIQSSSTRSVDRVQSVVSSHEEDVQEKL